MFLQYLHRVHPLTEDPNKAYKMLAAKKSFKPVTTVDMMDEDTPIADDHVC